LDFSIFVPVCDLKPALRPPAQGRAIFRVRKPCLFLSLICLAHYATAETVWIDTDISIGSPIREVDDAFALVLAFHSPEIRIAGLSTTYGNAPLGQTTRAARDLVERFGQSAGLTIDAVFAGAGSASDLGRRSAASDALAAVLQREKIAYIAVGPLTNLATFLRIHPRLANQIERIIFVGGGEPGARLAFGPSRSFHIHDANVFKDPAAAAAVLQSNIPLTLVPIAAGSHLLVDGTDLRQLARSGGAGSYLSRQARIWLWFWTHFVKTNGGPIFDALGVIPVTRPELLSIRKRYAKMDQAGNLIVTPSLTSGARPVRYCTDFAPGTKNFVMQRLLARQSRK
jgi:inosine-uridine nucleoside N-ribohydrolase